MVGRDLERELLARLLAGVEAGVGRVAWVKGQPGIGKSTLLASAGHAARARGWRVVVGHGEQTRERFALAAFLGPLADLPWAATIVAELSELSDVSGGTDSLALAPVDARVAAVSAVAAWLERLAGEAPLVVMLDDVQ